MSKDIKALKTVIWNIRVTKEDKESFMRKCRNVGFKNSSEAFRTLLKRAQTSEDIIKNMQTSKLALSYINSRGECIAISVRITEKEKQNFIKLCEATHYTPAKVARAIIVNWCDS